MNRWLQDFSFKKSGYDRPNQKWICGRACDGRSCLTGPDQQGHCTAGPECQPIRKGDRWHCTRLAALGGPCADGPKPDGSCSCVMPKCIPVRSLRAWRGITVRLVAGACLALVLFLLGSRVGGWLLSPGDLTFAHASVSTRCSDCHQGVSERPIAWLATASYAGSAGAGSRLCLRCHNVGSNPENPHSLPAERLAMLTGAMRANAAPRATPLGLKIASVVSPPGHAGTSPLSCATCHHEHRGTGYDLRQLSNQQCQACHARQFASLSDGHPAFSSYPFVRRTRIIFDHEAHLLNHFTDPAVAGRALRSCLDCHQTDLKGNTMGLKPFATICAACHDSQIKGKGAVNAGIAFISLPHFDDRVMTGPYAIGQWPEDADQPVTPFMRLLLAADPALKSSLAILGNADLSDLPKNDPAKLMAAQQLAWGIKGLIYDLGRLGQAELSRRVEAALGRPLTEDQREGVVAFLNAEALGSAFNSSFPNLASEMINYRQQHKIAKTDWVPSPSPPPAAAEKSAKPEDWVANGGWYSPDGSFTLYYHPRGHADRFLSVWLDLTLTTAQATDPGEAKAVFDQLSAPKAPGYCAKCHSLDAVPAPMVNWRGAQPDSQVHEFNHFSHRSHLSLIGKAGCYMCHPLKTGASQSYLAAFAPGRGDPSQFRSNFQVINKATCAKCHCRGQVRDDCLLCHNYHVGVFQAVTPNARVTRPPSQASSPTTPEDEAGE